MEDIQIYHNSYFDYVPQSKMIVRLSSVKKSDISFLYELLSQRDPRANISHKNMPTYEEHKKFVMSKPYSKWYIIYYNDKKAGSIYLTKQNEIGIFLLMMTQRKGIGSDALHILMKKNPRCRYLANVSPRNKNSMFFFTRNGFKLIQYTYELIFTKNKSDK